MIVLLQFETDNQPVYQLAVDYFTNKWLKISKSIENPI